MNLQGNIPLPEPDEFEPGDKFANLPESSVLSLEDFRGTSVVDVVDVGPVRDKG
jgi:hypothetical protein